ncbi:hypothetical protein AB0I81_22560 [Nonomuraea sp. NPDC050404]|uniref:hypothetical protein n=1 Tax=Nonomuraea sp. NPDC050404 TaxID=3155783 RepID=UPI00340C2EF4
MSDPFAAASSRLQSAIARWLTDHGVADPANGAVEIAHIVRGHGWRPMPGLQRPSASGDAVAAPSERPEIAEVRARCAAAGERLRAGTNPERNPDEHF